MHSRFIGVAALLLGCVSGDDTSDAATQGSLGGPCFANSTCNPGLVCAIVNGKGVCEQSDATVQDAPADQTTTEGGGDATQDVAGDVAPVDAGCDAGVTPSAVCPGNCAGELCCPINGQCVTSGCGVTCNNTPCWSCSKGSDCSGQYCCASNSTLQPTCPPTASVNLNTNVYCSAAPCTNGFFLCVNSSDCPTTAPTCVPAKASGIFVSTIGVCQ